jgi:hypothetical protein
MRRIIRAIKRLLLMITIIILLGGWSQEPGDKLEKHRA